MIGADNEMTVHERIRLAMKIYEFGDSKNPTLMMLPGTSCHWENNCRHILPYLEPYFHVLCVSYDGFDETEDSMFISMLDEVEKIENYILEYFGGHITAVYGCSLGGSFVGLLAQRGRIHMEHGFLGSSDLDQSGKLVAWLTAKLVSPILTGVLHKGQLPGWLQKRIDKQDEEKKAYFDVALPWFGIGTTKMAFVKKESIFNQFYTDLITPLQENISVPGTQIHCFYATKMGKQYEARYRKHFANVDIHRHDMQHEELMLRYPEKWAALIIALVTQHCDTDSINAEPI